MKLLSQFSRQGLTFADGHLWESTGLYGQSKVRILDPSSGDVIKSIDMDPLFFGEGMTYWDEKLVQITWKIQQGYIYDSTAGLGMARDVVAYGG